MADIISIKGRHDDADKNRDAALNAKKMRAAGTVSHHLHRAPACEKCGRDTGAEATAIGEKFKLRVPYRFCLGCAEEYVDYIDRLRGQARADHYWQNDSWLEAWTRWIDYQSSVDRYVRSKEFTRLLNELINSRSDQ